MMNVTLNNEKNGIEIRFDSKPESEVLELLKANGFHWSGKQRMWYAKNSDERLSFVNGLSNGNIVVAENKAEKHADKYDLWEMTRTDGIEKKNDYIRYYEGGYCEAIKSIAALIRKEFKERFPMVRASVRVDHHDSIDVTIKSSPFEKKSEELSAITHYIYTFAQSYNYDNSDSMTDYFDVGFYGVYESGMVDYDYKQTECENINEICELYAQRKAEFEKAEAERKEREFREYLAKREIENAEAAKAEEIYNAEHDEILSGLVVNDVTDFPYFAMNLDNPGFSKACRLSEYTEDKDGHFRCNAKIVKEIRLTEKAYELFTRHLMDEFGFFTLELGGTSTDDLRIKSHIDYEYMTESERKTVETYENNCVAVYCGDVLKFVIDTEGFSYARYCFIFDNESHIMQDYKTDSGITLEEYREYSRLADMISNTGSGMVKLHNLPEFAAIGSEDYESFKVFIKEWIYGMNFPFSVGVVRAIEDNDMKRVMYGVLNEVESISEQFMMAGFEPEQKITIIHIGDFGGLNVTHGKFKSATVGKYAQYDNAVKLVFRPENKRNDYYKWLHGDVLIYDGWLDVPENLLWEVSVSNGLVCKKSKYLSCDRAMYDEVMNYFKQQNIRPIINTYKPQF